VSYSLDTEVRKAVALWCHAVAHEAPETTNHAERINVARNLVTKISSYDQTQDTLLPNIIGIVRAFAGDVASPSEITQALETILGTYIALGALQA
jgi:hypothetical protein